MRLLMSLLKKLKNLFGIEAQESRADKIQFGIFLIVQVSFIVAFFVSLYDQAWLSVFVSVAALVAVRLPSILEKNSRVHLPVEFEVLLALFIWVSLFLGEIHGFYTRFWWWDLVLHAGSGLALGFIGFLILFSLYRDKRFNMGAIMLSFFSFSFALALGTVWEIFEFAMDGIFGLNMQKSGLKDTMWDMIVNSGGALVASVFGYLYLKRKKGLGIFEHYIKSYLVENR